MTDNSQRFRTLPRYERAPEAAPVAVAVDAATLIPAVLLEDALAASSLSIGGIDLARGLIRLGRVATFAGGGAGIEYGSLLKTAARPEFMASHIREVAEHLTDQRVDMLMVPGMSGYPVGAMYSIVSGVPAVLLKKQRHLGDERAGDYPPGAFLIPSYTGEGDVLISADVAAVQDIVDTALRAQLASQQHATSLAFTLRVAGADDIIDKATMSQAVSESAVIIGKAAILDFVERHRSMSGDMRPATIHVAVVAWVTPLIKRYNRPQEHLQRMLGITPFAGLHVTSLHLDPAAIGIEGLGVVAFP